MSDIVKRLVVHRDEHGFADSIDDAEGNLLVHLRAGTERTEANIEALVARYNAMVAEVAELRDVLRLLERRAGDPEDDFAPDHPVGRARALLGKEGA